MKVHTPLCPECGESARGTVERLGGCAQFAGEPNADTPVEYSGWTEIWWDEQHTVLQVEDTPEGPENLPLVCCPNGHSWPSQIDW
jgi:hypothetical protein